MPLKDRLAPLLRPWGLIWLSIGFHWEALKGALRIDGIGALAHPHKIRDAASAKLFSTLSTGFVTFEDTTIVPSLVSAAGGVVLDLGPGPGNQIHRFDTSLVQYVYGVEPNRYYQETITGKLELEKNAALRDKYRLIVAGVEDSDALVREGITEGSLDAVLCIQVLCAVEDPGVVMKGVWSLLKPGGKFIFWEHGCSRSWVTAAAQAFWNPAWSTFVGCRLRRNVLADILKAGEWENPEEIEEPEDLVSLLPRVQGVLVKKGQLGTEGKKTR
ncbi:S-adenosyl-L-methionine-dependent methyltransferase [Aspergillus pseudoustus]|uniref:S-adenosyl-L-methionine-dependent methyltransferase n=1 Tax=Aspergillus pseudoustus TaxID=1810923 RepID=A0ABR4IT91_9EURO